MIQDDFGEVVIKDEDETIKYALPTKLKYDDKIALVKAGTPIITLIKDTEIDSTASGVIFPKTSTKQHREVLARDIAVRVLREESAGVFEVRYRNYNFYVRYEDLLFTASSKELATLKDKELITSII